MRNFKLIFYFISFSLINSAYGLDKVNDQYITNCKDCLSTVIRKEANQWTTIAQFYKIKNLSKFKFPTLNNGTYKLIQFRSNKYFRSFSIESSSSTKIIFHKATNNGYDHHFKQVNIPIDKKFQKATLFNEKGKSLGNVQFPKDLLQKTILVLIPKSTQQLKVKLNSLKRGEIRPIVFTMPTTKPTSNKYVSINKYNQCYNAMASIQYFKKPNHLYDYSKIIDQSNAVFLFKKNSLYLLLGKELYTYGKINNITNVQFNHKGQVAEQVNEVPVLNFPPGKKSNQKLYITSSSNHSLQLSKWPTDNYAVKYKYITAKKLSEFDFYSFKHSFLEKRSIDLKLVTVAASRFSQNHQASTDQYIIKQMIGELSEIYKSCKDIGHDKVVANKLHSYIWIEQIRKIENLIKNTPNHSSQNKNVAMKDD